MKTLSKSKAIKIDKKKFEESLILKDLSKKFNLENKDLEKFNSLIDFCNNQINSFNRVNKYEKKVFIYPFLEILQGSNSGFTLNPQVKIIYS